MLGAALFNKKVLRTGQIVDTADDKNSPQQPG